ncbi:MAG: DUF3997 domain-containing protein [Bacteroidetes bacterium]|nr:DUF3997 domain-containing protein [Bacteroidota bacterium]
MRIKILFCLILSVMLITSCSERGNVDLGGKYRLIHSANFIDMVIVKEYNEVAIHVHILSYAFDSTFILAAQRPRDSVPGIETMTHDKYDEVFEKSTFRQYWIIDKTKESVFDEATKKYSNVYGPFQKEEYLQKREELGVPQELKLKE